MRKSLYRETSKYQAIYKKRESYIYKKTHINSGQNLKKRNGVYISIQGKYHISLARYIRKRVFLILYILAKPIKGKIPPIYRKNLKKKR